MDLPQLPSLQRLRREYPTLVDKLQGSFGKENVYHQGNVVSWSLLGSCHGELKEESTVEIIEPGDYLFPTDHTEEVTVIEGILEAAVGQAELRQYRSLDMVVVPPGIYLRVVVREGAVLYVCEYK